jgi:hypothetical protein
MTAELSSAGVPGVAVNYSTPASATASDYAAWEADPATTGASSVTTENLLSPDPTNPLPTAVVQYGSPTATPIPGVLQPPGFGGYPALEDSNKPAWDLAALLTAKHRLAAGVSLAGVALQSTAPNEPYTDEPNAWVSVSASDVHQQSTTMSTQDATNQAKSALPEWAQVAGTVHVYDYLPAILGPGAERQLSVSLSLPSAAFVADDLPGLLDTVSAQQASLSALGANIGSVLVSISDPTTGQPLVAYAADTSFGLKFFWATPIMLPYIQGGPLTSRTVKGAVNSNIAGTGTTVP